jgi:hypothetical protein
MQYTFFSAAHGTFSLHHIRSQWNKTRPQKEKNPRKILKHMETEQHTANKPMGDQSNKGRIQVPRIQ